MALLVSIMAARAGMGRIVIAVPIKTIPVSTTTRVIQSRRDDDEVDGREGVVQAATLVTAQSRRIQLRKEIITVKLLS